MFITPLVISLYKAFKTHHDIKITVDHDWAPPSEIDVLLPPVTHLDMSTKTLFFNHSFQFNFAMLLSNVTHIIRRPPGFKNQVSLQLAGFVLSEVIGQSFHLAVLLIVQQGAYGLKVLWIELCFEMS